MEPEWMPRGEFANYVLNVVAVRVSAVFTVLEWFGAV